MEFWIDLLVTAGVTYLVRMVPLVLVKAAGERVRGGKTKE